MDRAYQAVVQLFYQLANAFFWPVAIALIVLFVYAMVDLGRLWFTMWRRRRQGTADARLVADALVARLAAAEGSLHDVHATSIPPSVGRFWQHVERRLMNERSTDDIDLWLDAALRTEEVDVATHLDRSRALVRIGPMLGLAGTIIPLGPALQALLGGDMPGMVNHLVVGFGAVVCGLMLSGVAYYITLVRERWARVELKELEDLCELVMRQLQRDHVKRETVGGRHASVRTA
jgi:biopolymer transport protein ExbB/TolQ